MTTTQLIAIIHMLLVLCVVLVRRGTGSMGVFILMLFLIPILFIFESVVIAMLALFEVWWPP